MKSRQTRPPRAAVGIILLASIVDVGCRGRASGDPGTDGGTITEDGGAPSDAGFVADAGFVEDAGTVDVDAGPIFPEPLPLDAPPVIFGLAAHLYDQHIVDVFWESDAETCDITVDVDGVVERYEDQPPEGLQRNRIVRVVDDPTRVEVVAVCHNAFGASTRRASVTRPPASVLRISPEVFDETTDVEVCVEAASGDCTLAIDREAFPRVRNGFMDDSEGNMVVTAGVTAGSCVTVVADNSLFATLECRQQEVRDAPTLYSSGGIRSSVTTFTRAKAGDFATMLDVRLLNPIIDRGGRARIEISGHSIASCAVNTVPVPAPGVVAVTPEAEFVPYHVSCLSAGGASKLVVVQQEAAVVDVFTSPFSSSAAPSTQTMGVRLRTVEGNACTFLAVDLSDEGGDVQTLNPAGDVVQLGDGFERPRSVEVIAECSGVDDVVSAVGADRRLGFAGDLCDDRCVSMDVDGEWRPGCGADAFLIACRDDPSAFGTSGFVADLDLAPNFPAIRFDEVTLPSRRSQTALDVNPGSATCEVTLGEDLLATNVTEPTSFEVEVDAVGTEMVASTCVLPDERVSVTRRELSRGPFIRAFFTEEHLSATLQYVSACQLVLTGVDGTTVLPWDGTRMHVGEEIEALTITCVDPFGTTLSRRMSRETRLRVGEMVDERLRRVCNDGAQECAMGPVVPPGTCVSIPATGQDTTASCGLSATRLLIPNPADIALKVTPSRLPGTGGEAHLRWQVPQPGCRLRGNGFVIDADLSLAGELDLPIVERTSLSIECPNTNAVSRTVAVGPFLQGQVISGPAQRFVWESAFVRDCTLGRGEFDRLRVPAVSQRGVFLSGSGTSATLRCTTDDGEPIGTVITAR